MRPLLDEARLDRVVSRRRDWLLGGAFVMSLVMIAPRGWGFGLTGFTALSLGVYASALRRWRTEPGLWMLALFLTLTIGGSWAFFEFGSLANLLDRGNGNPAGPPMSWSEIGCAADASLALLLGGRGVWFLASIAVANWARVRRPIVPPGRGSDGPAQPGRQAEGDPDG